MISHHYRCIFIHVPKCAGTSIEHLLGHHEGHKGTGGQDHRPIRMIEPLKRPWYRISPEYLRTALRRYRYQKKPAANYRNRFTVTEEQYHSYFKFTVVRNPWARLFSWYRGAVRNEQTRKMYRVTGNPDFRDYFYQHVGRGYMRPAGYWLKTVDGEYPYDLIARFEQLDRDMKVVLDQIGLKEKALPHKLPGSGLDYREF